MAKRCQFKTSTEKIKIFFILNRLFLKSRFSPQKNREVNQDIFSFTVTGFSYDSLLFLFKEIFVNNDYYINIQNANPKIIDCGANIGMSILFFKYLYPNSSIIAFEPNPFVFQLLKKNISQNGLKDVRIENIGLSNSTGNSEFYLGEYNGSLMGSVIRSRGGDRVFTIETNKLSSYIESTAFDLVKIDIEGAEINVLEDLIQTGTLKCSKMYIIEYHHRIDSSKSSLSKFLRPFELHGFEYNIKTTFDNPDQFQDILILFKQNDYK